MMQKTAPKTEKKIKMTQIMIDPGHAGSTVNRSPSVPDYYESNMTWALAGKLKTELEKHGAEVRLTRVSKDENPELTERGRSAAGCDAFVSLHSNASGDERVTAPWMICFSPDEKTQLDELSRSLAEAVGPVVSRVMDLPAPFYYTRSVDFDRDGNGYIDDEYYGVLFGAKSVGVPGIIVEHGFHTNKKTAEWLMNEENLDVLARAEAEAIAKYFGISEGSDEMTEAEKKDFAALKAAVEKLTAENKKLSGAVSAVSGDSAELKRRLDVYDKMEVYDNAAVRWAYIDGNLPDWSRETVQKLVNRGYLKGGDKNSLELSRLMLRILVILDRAGVFE